MNTEWNFSTKAIHHKKTLNESSNAVSQPVIPAVAYAFNRADEAAATVTGEIGRAHGLNSSNVAISYAVFCLKKKKNSFNNKKEKGKSMIIYLRHINEN